MFLANEKVLELQFLHIERHFIKFLNILSRFHDCVEMIRRVCTFQSCAKFILGMGFLPKHLYLNNLEDQSFYHKLTYFLAKQLLALHCFKFFWQFLYSPILFCKRLSYYWPIHSQFYRDFPHSSLNP